MNPSELALKLEEAKRRNLVGSSISKWEALQEWDNIRLLVKRGLIKHNKDYKLVKKEI